MYIPVLVFEALFFHAFQKSTQEKLLNSDLGQLMILLHYQPLANRLKVVVNKAAQLPSVENLYRKPGTLTIIMRNSKLIKHQLDT